MAALSRFALQQRFRRPDFHCHTTNTGRRRADRRHPFRQCIAHARCPGCRSAKHRQFALIGGHRGHRAHQLRRDMRPNQHIPLVILASGLRNLFRAKSSFDKQIFDCNRLITAAIRAAASTVSKVVVSVRWFGHSRVADNGKPAERRGRKATGLKRGCYDSGVASGL